MTVPRELTRSTPRHTEFTGAGRALIALIFLLFVGALVGATLLYNVSISTAEHAQVRARDAVTATGTVLEAIHRKNDWRMKFQFEVNGRTIEGHSTGKQFAPGTPVTIGYLPNDPTDSWILGQEPKPVPLFVSPLAGIALSGMAVALFLKLRRQKYLLENGRAAVARATASKRIHRGKQRVYATEFEYRQPSGALATGRVETGRAIPVDTEFIILYDPDEPKKVKRYPMALVRVAE